MTDDTPAIWARLRKAGLVDGAEPAPGDTESPWYVKLLLAFSGWLAALFLLGFIGTIFSAIINDSTASFISGGIMVAAAFTLLRLPKGAFYEHLSLALSLAGQMLMIWAIFTSIGESSGFNQAFWLLTGLLQTLLAIVMPNFIHRVFSAFIAAFAFAFALAGTGVPYVFSGITLFVAAWLWLHEFRYPQQMRKMQAIGYGLVLAVLALTGSGRYDAGALQWQVSNHSAATWLQPWLGDILISGVLFYVVWQLLQRSQPALSQRHQLSILAGTLLAAAASVEVPGASAGLALMLLGFAGSNRSLLGLGVISLLFNLSAYYYFLDITLLGKALNLLIVGLLLLAIRGWLLRITRKITVHENA